MFCWMCCLARTPAIPFYIHLYHRYHVHVILLTEQRISAVLHSLDPLPFRLNSQKPFFKTYIIHKVYDTSITIRTQRKKKRKEKNQMSSKFRIANENSIEVFVRLHMAAYNTAWIISFESSSSILARLATANLWELQFLAHSLWRAFAKPSLTKQCASIAVYCREMRINFH